MSITHSNEKPITNNSNIPPVTTKSPSLSSPLNNILSNANNTPINQFKESTKLASDRRVTFTLSNSETQTSNLNVAVVPPNARREIQNGVALGNVENSVAQETNDDQIGLFSRALDSSIGTHRSDLDITPDSSTNVFRTEPVTVKTPEQITPPILPSSAGGDKRTLKRRGQCSIAAGTSASTSKLLKGLSTYRPSTKAKVTAINAGNLHKTTAFHQTTTNVPSYMSATTASSRKLNFVQGTTDCSTKQSNLNILPVIKSNATVSPKQGDIPSGTFKENEEPKVHLLTRTKDSTG
jgi:hypothetical protein